jgi:histidyl-tRNA synthetase
MTIKRVAPISGFPEWLPGACLAEQRLVDTIREQFELFGFGPIETPAVERMSVLTAKGQMQRQIFTLGRPEDDDSDATLGLHFDLTVPLARYVGQHGDQLCFPFRRYQIQKVWRGERAQRGRFREFTQCDIDIIGANSLDTIHDAEVLAVTNAVFDAIGLPAFKIHLSHRGILKGLFAAFDLAEGQAADALRVIDKAGRQGLARVQHQLAEDGMPTPLVDSVADLVGVVDLDAAREILSRHGADTAGIDELAFVVKAACDLGLPDDRIRIDLSITRGLDYYTGTVYETFIGGHEAWGSVCSGGRYDDLAGRFTHRRMPGVGVSIGLTRLFNLLVEGEHWSIGPNVATHVLVTMQNRDRYLQSYLGLARTLRASGIPTEVYLEHAPLRDQIAYASAQGIPIAVIAGDREHDTDTVIIRQLRHHIQETVTGDDMVRRIGALIGPQSRRGAK